MTISHKIGLFVAALLALGTVAGTAVAAGTNQSGLVSQPHAKMSSPHR